MIEFKNISVTYPGGVEALKNITLDITEGDFVIIVGMSGAGKSTLLRTINNLVEPTEGEVLVDSKNVTNASKKELKVIRSDIGMILNQCNVAVRTGHHCCMPLMQRFGIDGTVRVSFGLYNDMSDVDALLIGMEKVKKLLL